jgi:hypothetical protein
MDDAARRPVNPHADLDLDVAGQLPHDLCRRGIEVVNLRDHAGAALAAGQLLEAAVDQAGDPFRAGTVLAQCLSLAGKDPRLNETQRSRLTATYAERALNALHRAVENGYRDARQLETDLVFDPLRGQVGFQKLVNDLKAKNAPGRRAAGTK